VVPQGGSQKADRTRGSPPMVSSNGESPRGVSKVGSPKGGHPRGVAQGFPPRGFRQEVTPKVSAKVCPPTAVPQGRSQKCGLPRVPPCRYPNGWLFSGSVRGVPQGVLHYALVHKGSRPCWPQGGLPTGVSEGASPNGLPKGTSPRGSPNGCRPRMVAQEGRPRGHR
jgi:hypothetical protein